MSFPETVLIIYPENVLILFFRMVFPEIISENSEIDDWMSFPETGLCHALEICQYGLTKASEFFGTNKICFWDILENWNFDSW